jgi:outer membrane protein OmpA-like peptidoglycan-associated protein
MSRNLSPRRFLLLTCLGMLIVSLFTAVSFAQDQPAPKVEVFTGYEWLHPGVQVPQPGLSPDAPVALKLPDMPKGFGVSATYNFTPVFGFEGDISHNWTDLGHDTIAAIGPKITWRTENNVNLFAHALLGWNRLDVNGLTTSDALGSLVGGGMDLRPWKKLSIRVFQVDYVWAAHHFPAEASQSFGDLRRPHENGVRLGTGLVWNFGGAPPVPPAASCSIQPSEVMVGEPVTATVNTSNFNPKHTLTYTWSSTGGKITGKDTSATVDTNGIAGGSYTVTARVSDPKMKNGGEASCNANFAVKEPPKNPPKMTCSANPASVQAGTPVNLTCDCSSPDNVPVTVSGWTASAGTVNGNGANATLDTTNVPAGPVTVNASCADTRGLTTPASTQVDIQSPPPPPPPQASKLSQCDFPNEKKPWRVDNTCKAVLDDVALRLQRENDTKLVIVGNNDPSEKRKNLAAERAVNSKAYLSGGEAKQGIDPSRIETRTGNAGTKTAEYWVVPTGATYSGEGTQPVDEMKVKAVPDHPRAPAKKK